MSIATKMKAASEDTQDDILAKADTLVAKGSAALGKAGEATRETTDLALKEISDLMTTLNDKIGALGADAGSLREKAKDAYGEAESFIAKEVSDRPLRTLVVVGLAGLALGLLARK
jgi:ElaB/YqjD/DUF883 family membrane-anchored ribosome-binding protein